MADAISLNANQYQPAMPIHSRKHRADKSSANTVSQHKHNTPSTSPFVDNRPETVQRQKLQETANQYTEQHTPQLVDNRAVAVAQRQLQETAAGHLGQKEQPVQRLIAMTGLSQENYKKKLRTTVILYAELGGAPVGDNNGIFETTRGNHAEENLIAYLAEAGINSGELVIYLSTSPCSSEFGTRTDGEEGCQEKLETLNTGDFNVTVHADHLYQPKATGAMERENGYPTGFSSASALASAPMDMDVSHASRALHNDDWVVGGDVAQLKNNTPQKT